MLIHSRHKSTHNPFFITIYVTVFPTLRLLFYQTQRNASHDTHLVLDRPVIGFLEPRSQYNRVVGVAHRPQQRGRRVAGILRQRELRDQHSEEMRVRTW